MVVEKAISNVAQGQSSKERVSVIGKLLKGLGKYFLLLIFSALILVFSTLSPNFLTFNNLMNILNQNVYIMLAAIGVSFVMIGGGIDLSLGYQISIVSVCVAIFMKVLGWSILPTIMVGLGIGIVVGGLTGLLSVSLNLHPLLVSLGTMTIYRGVSYMISKSRAYFDLPANFKYLGQGYVGKVPFSLFVVVIAFLIMDFILRKTYFGRYTYAVGGNPDAARLAGISIGRMKVILFSISGFFAGLSAVMMTARAGSANSAMGPGTEFDAITACVLGGVSFMGGEGNLSGVMVAAIILGILSNGMQLVGLGVYTQFVAKGIILIGALAYDDYQRRRTTTV